ncbi:relaxase/mobilization nuclease domain-containing protein [Sphingomonas carotinifaciens]|nr:relaxase/mobilization nuclease domain-containing protein [Sphingomonas carotinifaciens]
MAGIFSPSKRHSAAGGGGGGRERDHGGTLLGFAVASMFPKPASQGGGHRSHNRVKQAFGGGSQAAISRRAISTLDRTARRVPEVMVRITGRQHGAGHVLANFAYISRLGHGADREVALYTSEGDVVRDGNTMQDLAHDWQEWEMADDARRKGATSLSMILSMPSGTDPERLKAAALDFAREEFANRSWVASLHVDRDHPHVHVTFARRDHDGRRFHPTRDDLFRYRQRFAQKLRDRGIEANATPSKARGVDSAHEPMAARKIRETGRVPRLDESRKTRVRQLAPADASNPLRATRATRQASVRAAYEQSIAVLRTSPSIVNQTVATSLQRFVEVMTVPEPYYRRTTGTRDQAPAEGRRPLSVPSGERAHIDNPIAAALVRSQAMRERIETRRAAHLADSEPAGPSDHRPASSPARTRPPTSPQPIDPASPVREPDRIDQVMRELKERERTRAARLRDRDLNPEKGGPKR